MFRTAFISYGGPDEVVAGRLDAALRRCGIKTWFFPRDAVPGQKLHRTMFQGVNDHDRTVFLCSENSLSRKGVLNELERVLEREAAEGGLDILIPVTIDDYVFSDWAPSKPDLALQIRSRVIARLPSVDDLEVFEQACAKVVDALRLSSV